MRPRVLVLGFGNPGRLDDGLGPAVVRALEAYDLPGVTLDADYQLRLEDAAAVVRHDAVVFVDATTEGPAPFAVREVAAEAGRRFTTHSVPPGALLDVARRCFGIEVPAWLVAVRGYAFDDFGEGLSAGARDNLDAAVTFLAEVLAGRPASPRVLLDRKVPEKGVPHA